MARVKRGKNKTKKRRNLLKKTKGYRGRQKSHKRSAKEALTHAGRNAYRDRKRKKGDMRRQWQIVIGAAAKNHGLSYSRFTHLLKENDVELDRKVLAEMAQNQPEAFAAVVESVS